MAGLRSRVKALKEQIAAVSTLPTDKSRYVDNLGAYLDRIAAGKARAPRAEMRLLAMAVVVLTGNDVGGEVDDALALGKAYDARVAARLVRAALR